MTSRRFIIVLIFIIAVGGAAITFLAPPISPVIETPCVKSGETCLRFPTITGTSLTGENYTLPENFAGEYTFVIVPFDEEQQINAETWLPLTRELAAKYPRLSYYNVPVFPDIPAPIRTVIRGGMSLAIADEQLRRITITVFLENRDAFLSALDIPDTEAIQVFFLNSTGEVVWRGAGIFTTEQGEMLSKVVDEFLN